MFIPAMLIRFYNRYVFDFSIAVCTDKLLYGFDVWII